MIYSLHGKAFEFDCSFGTIRAIEKLRKTSLMKLIASSYSSSGTIDVDIDAMLELLTLAYTRAHPSVPQDVATKELLEELNSGTYQDIVQLYDKLLVSLQYDGKSDEEIEEIIAGNMMRAEAQRNRMQELIRKREGK